MQKSVRLSMRAEKMFIIWDYSGNVSVAKTLGTTWYHHSLVYLVSLKHFMTTLVIGPYKIPEMFSCLGSGGQNYMKRSKYLYVAVKVFSTKSSVHFGRD